MRRPTVMAGASLGMMAAAVAAMSASVPMPAEPLKPGDEGFDHEYVKQVLAANEARRQEQKRRAQERIAEAEAKRARRRARNLKNLER